MADLMSILQDLAKLSGTREAYSPDANRQRVNEQYLSDYDTQHEKDHALQEARKAQLASRQGDLQKARGNAVDLQEKMMAQYQQERALAVKAAYDEVQSREAWWQDTRNRYTGKVSTKEVQQTQQMLKAIKELIQRWSVRKKTEPNITLEGLDRDTKGAPDGTVARLKKQVPDKYLTHLSDDLKNVKSDSDFHTLNTSVDTRLAQITQTAADTSKIMNPAEETDYLNQRQQYEEAVTHLRNAYEPNEKKLHTIRSTFFPQGQQKTSTEEKRIQDTYTKADMPQPSEYAGTYSDTSGKTSRVPSATARPEILSAAQEYAGKPSDAPGSSFDKWYQEKLTKERGY